MIEFVIFITIIFATIWSSIAGFVMLINIYLIKSLKYISTGELQGLTSNTELLLSFILPVSVVLIVLIKLILNKIKIKYKFDLFDFFFILLIILLAFGTLFAYDINNAIGFTIKVIFFGYCYFFIIKLYLSSNVETIRKKLEIFFLSSLFLSIILAIISIIYLVSTGAPISRLSLPATNVIPFSQLIGLGVLILWFNLITVGSFLNVKNKYFLFLNIPFFALLFISLIITNTRGVIIATIASMSLIVLLVKGTRRTIKTLKLKTIIMVSVVSMTIFIINIIGVEVLLDRTLNHSIASNEERYIILNDSIRLISNNIFGIGTNDFSQHSVAEYPHNIFLELIVSFGIFGFALSIFLILINIHTFVYLDRRDLVNVFLYLLTIFYLIEAQFSFNLATNKGLYVSFGLLSAYLFFKNKTKTP
tara:strand:- start:4032 stop:5288 length:1257 start_codon:yes stop_codon:yes gene_type:complete